MMYGQMVHHTTKCDVTENGVLTITRFCMKNYWVITVKLQ